MTIRRRDGDVSRKNRWLTLVELAVVFLVTAAALAWGKHAALTERGYAAYGGECLLILIPVVYYVIRSMK